MAYAPPDALPPAPPSPVGRRVWFGAILAAFAAALLWQIRTVLCEDVEVIRAQVSVTTVRGLHACLLLAAGALAAAAP